MVEALIDDFIRETTPVPSMSLPPLPVRDQKESPTAPTGYPLVSPDLYDIELPGGSKAVEADTSSDLNDAPDPAASNAKGGVSGSSMPNRRRSPRSRSTSHRPPNSRSPSSFPPNYAVSSPSSLETSPNNAFSPTIFPSSSLHYPATTLPLSHTQRQGHRQYAMSTQPLSINHTPPPFYSHPYQHSGPMDGMVSPGIHAGYQPMLQPPTSVYPYQHHSPESGSITHNSYIGAGNSPIYPQHPLNTSLPIHSPPPQYGAGQSSAHSSSYMAPTQYRPVQHPSPISAPHYAYSPQPFPGSPSMYGPQYGHSPYFASPQESGQQGTWWYLPHSTATPQHRSAPTPYQLHYPMTYAISHRSMDASYSAGPSSPHTTPSIYSVSPGRPAAQESSDQHTTLSSPHIPNTTPPIITDASSGNGRSQTAETQPVRRSYHPNPPAHRSEWVMWVGNVPSDATHDELWRFLNLTSESSPGGTPPPTGVISIFLISRSSCAFVNFESEAYLYQAIKRYNGVPLRDTDPRCPRLVCRVRKKDDDLKAGVGGQRGMGLHTRWVKDHQGKGGLESSDASDVSASDGRISTSSPDPLTPAVASVSSDDERHHPNARHSGSSGSYTSTTSSLLTRYFPKRYFILKSLTQFDLDLSVEKGLWATQKHNEGILDQAYRTSQHVYLLFSVNKSGEFYGYARMAGPVRGGEHRVSWATRTMDSPGSSRSSLSPVIGRGTPYSANNSAEPTSPSRSSRLKTPNDMFFSPSANRLVENSPLPAGSAEMRRQEQASYIEKDPRLQAHSAPADLGTQRRKLTFQTPTVKHSLDLSRINLDEQGSSDDFELDSNAPIRAIRSSSSRSSGDSQEQGSLSREVSLLQVVEEEEEKGSEGAGHEPLDNKGGVPNVGEDEENEATWGEPFKIEWLSTEKLPFQRTKHIRNPWNHDREVKVSRDGTELEPTVGQKLLEQWARLASEAKLPTTQGKTQGPTKRSARSVPPSHTAPGGGKTGRG